MAYYKRKQDVKEIMAGHGHSSFPLLGEEQGCTNGCCAGISYYSALEYTPIAVHEDQEGFIVLSGTGQAKIGEEEFGVEEEMAFIVPKGVAHQMKSNNEEEPLVLFWFHAQS